MLEAVWNVLPLHAVVPIPRTPAVEPGTVENPNSRPSPPDADERRWYHSLRDLFLTVAPGYEAHLAARGPIDAPASFARACVDGLKRAPAELAVAAGRFDANALVECGGSALTEILLSTPLTRQGARTALLANTLFPSNAPGEQARWEERRVVWMGAGLQLSMLAAGYLSLPIAAALDIELDAEKINAPLSRAQREAIKLARTAAIPASKEAEGTLYELAAELGYNRTAADACFEELRDAAPITINFDPGKRILVDSSITTAHAHTDGARTVAQALRVDPCRCYRNQYETGLTGGAPSAHVGGSRFKTEQRLWPGAYIPAPGPDYDASTFVINATDMPRYGALNYEQRPIGAASFYGKATFVLNEAVKARATLTSGDSIGCGSGARMGTFDAWHHLLADVGVDTRRRILKQCETGSPATIRASSYIEVQVHGPVRLDHDVQHMTAPRGLEGTDIGNDVVALANEIRVPLQWY